MLQMPKELNLSRFSVMTESIVLKLEPNAKKNLEYFLDALNFLYVELKKNTKVENIRLFLLSLKPKIDAFIGTKQKEPVYRLLNTAIGQWMQEDTGTAYLRLDRPSKINKNNKIKIPLQNCQEVDFVSPDIYKRHVRSYYDPFIRIMKVNNIFIAEILFYLPNPSEKKFYINEDRKVQNVSQDSFFKKPIQRSVQEEDSHQAYINYRQKYKQTNFKGPKLSNTPKTAKVTESSLDTGQRIQANKKKSTYENSARNNHDAWLNYQKKFQNTQSVDAKSVSEILSAFNEVKARRSASNNEYLQQFYKNGGGIGKFGLPQAKWRNGTYGINSKEPDFFSAIDR